MTIESKYIDRQTSRQTPCLPQETSLLPPISRTLASETGFSLIELIMIIVILGFLSAIMVPFIQSFLSSPDPMLRQQAVSIGQALMDEIISKKWDENTPVGGGPVNTVESVRGSVAATAVGLLAPEALETRATYDDVDDYNGFIEPSPFSDQTGTSSVTFSGFSRQATVTYIASNSNPINSATAASATTTDTKLIMVTVTSPINETYTFVSVACNL